MIYLSMGSVQKTQQDGALIISHYCEAHALNAENATLWKSGQHAPYISDETPNLRSLQDAGLMRGIQETGDRILDVYRLLTNCILMPVSIRKIKMLFAGKETRYAYTWLTRSELHLTAAELVRLMELGVRPVPSLLGPENRQRLVETIYTTGNIFDGVLESQMEHSTMMPGVVSVLLVLLKIGAVSLF